MSMYINISRDHFRPLWLFEVQGALLWQLAPLTPMIIYMHTIPSCPRRCIPIWVSYSTIYNEGQRDIRQKTSNGHRQIKAIRWTVKQKYSADNVLYLLAPSNDTGSKGFNSNAVLLYLEDEECDARCFVQLPLDWGVNDLPVTLYSGSTQIFRYSTNLFTCDMVCHIQGLYSKHSLHSMLAKWHYRNSTRRRQEETQNTILTISHEMKLIIVSQSIGWMDRRMDGQTDQKQYDVK